MDKHKDLYLVDKFKLLYTIAYLKQKESTTEALIPPQYTCQTEESLQYPDTPR